MTWLPRSENIDANSQPMAPPPITANDAGRASSDRTSSEVSTNRPSTSKPGMVRGADPVARTTLRPVISNAPPSAPAVGLDPDPVVREQGPRAVEGNDAPALHEPGQTLEQLVDHFLLAALADREVHHGLTGLHPEFLGPRHGTHHAGGLEELLGRDTPSVQARPAHLVVLHDGDSEPGGSSVEGGGVTAGPAADHDDIEFGGFGRRDHLRLHLGHRERASGMAIRKRSGSSLTGTNPHPGLARGAPGHETNGAGTQTGPGTGAEAAVQGDRGEWAAGREDRGEHAVRRVETTGGVSGTRAVRTEGNTQ